MRHRSLRVLALLPALGVSGTSLGCGLLLGLNEFVDQKVTSSTTGTGAGGAATSSGSAGGHGGGSTTSGGTTQSGTTSSGTTGSGGNAGGSCSDGVKNGSETGIDCGGTCAACADGGGCVGAQDCTSKVCTNGICVAASCNDGVKNGGESDQDCGGATCAGCAAGKMCGVGSDCGSAVCQGGVCIDNYVWGKRITLSSLWSGPYAAVDASGHTLMAASCAKTIDFGGGPLTSAGVSSIGLARFDASGGHLWSKMFWGSNGQFVSGIAADSAGGVYISGNFSGSMDFGLGALASAGLDDLFLAKLDASGVPLWSKRFGDASQQWGGHIAIAANNDVVLVGGLQGTADFGGGPLVSAGKNDVYVAKFNAAGAPLWSYRYGNAADQTATSVVVDGSSNLLVSGGFAGALDFGGGPLVSTSTADCFVVKLTAQGSHLWSKRFGSSGGMSMKCLAGFDNASNVVLTGTFQGSVDFGGGSLTSTGIGDAFAAKLDASGKHLWSKRFGSVDGVYLDNATVDSTGNVVLVVDSTGTIDFGGGPLTSAGYSDVFVAKLSPAGDHMWSRHFGDGLDQHGSGSAAYDSENIVVTGSFGGTIDFGGGPLVSSGNGDLFLAKLRLP